MHVLKHMRHNLPESPVNCEWGDVACPFHAQLCAVAAAAAAVAVSVAAAAVAAAAAAPGSEAAAAAAVTGGFGADAVAVGVAGEHTTPVAVETGIGSTQRDAACGRVGPGCHTQGATAPAAPSHLMREKRRRNVTKQATRNEGTRIQIAPFPLGSLHTVQTISHNIMLPISLIIQLPHTQFETIRPI